jgi:hypothetical protein
LPASTAWSAPATLPLATLLLVTHSCYPVPTRPPEAQLADDFDEVCDECGCAPGSRHSLDTLGTLPPTRSHSLAPAM